MKDGRSNRSCAARIPAPWILAATAIGAAEIAAPPDPLPFPRRDAVVAVVETAGPAVIYIHAERRVERDFDWLFRDFFEIPEAGRREVQGSGVMIHPAGYAITNYHVCHGASEIQVAVDAKRRRAEVVAVAPEDDLAILRIEGGPFPVVRVGRSDDLMVGERVIALGMPFGLEKTVTTGVVCATNRSVTLPSGRATFRDFIQIDAAINPGNSGGPLLNVRGELIGINTAILNQGWGISFAIPVDRVKAKLRQLAGQELYLGFEYEEGPAGVRVLRVLPDSPAARAGIQAGDAIRAANGLRVENLFDLTNALLGTGFDRRIALSIEGRGGVRSVTLNALSGSDTIIEERLGLSGVDVSLAAGSGYAGGIRVERVERGGPAAEIGIRPGDTIVGVAAEGEGRGRPVEIETPDRSSLARVLRALSPGDRLGIRLLRSGVLYEGRCVLRGK